MHTHFTFEDQVWSPDIRRHLREDHGDTNRYAKEKYRTLVSIHCKLHEGHRIARDRNGQPYLERDED